MTPEQAIERLGSMPELQPGTAPKITPADIEAEIASEFYFTAANGVTGRAVDAWRRESPDVEYTHTFPSISHQDESDKDQAARALTLLTFCVLVLRNGFTVTGESACASPENFDAEVGRDVARKAAVAKVWPLLGYELRTKLANADAYRQKVWAEDDRIRAAHEVKIPTAAGPYPAGDEVKITGREIAHNINDQTTLVRVTGQRGQLCRVECEEISTEGYYITASQYEQKLHDATCKAAEKVRAWFATHDANGD